MENTSNTHAAAVPAWLELVRDKVESLSYGVVQLVVHNGRVTQIERTEKTRVSEPALQPRTS